VPVVWRHNYKLCGISNRQFTMILDLTQITDIIVNNPGRSLVAKGCEYNKLLRMHMYGEGLDQHLQQIEGFEKEQLKKLRVMYTKSNKDLFARLGRPVDKVFSARGGSIYYKLPEAQDKRARNLALNVRDGYSIRKWVEAFWKPHLLDDPAGIIFMELLPVQQAQQARKEGRSFVYPTYKSIGTIYDYLPKGSQLEYVVFNVPNSEKKKNGYKEDDQIFRVVDDAFDYWVKRDGEYVTILNELTFPNYFMAVPAIMNSDIVNPQLEGSYLSLYDDVVELAEHFLLKGSIKVVSDLRHGFPKYSEFADNCGDCAGTGFVGGDNCKTCKGTGKAMMLRVSDVKLLNWPDSKETPVIKPAEVGGYIEPSKTYYEIATADLSMLEDLMNVTLWGVQSRAKTQGMAMDSKGDAKTATEIMDEVKPQSDRLHPISEMAEKRHKFILDAVVRLQVAMNYEGSSVNYGRRYMLEGPDAIWEKYADARLKGVAIGALDDLLVEYYEAKFMSDPVKLAIQLKLMRVEPFVHYKIGEVQAFRPGPEDYKAKLYFGEWLSEQNDGIILATDVNMLRESLYEFSGKKQIVEDKPEPITP
jgi:hypothetical protein